MRKSILTIVSALAVFTGLSAEEFMLMENGVSKCSIVIGKDAGTVEKNAAAELARYLGKIGGGKAPSVGNEAVPETYPVKLCITDDKAVAPEGFRIEANKNGATVSGKNSLGTLYGVYEILKRYGGIRWLTPGSDGEYFTVRKTISIPEQNKVCNPSFKIRTIFFEYGNPKDEGTCKWMVRNNMRIETFSWMSRIPHMKKVSSENGGIIRDGLHSFTPLLNTGDVKDMKKNIAALYQSDPEIFPLVKGKRMPLPGNSDDRIQPCTSNPKTTEIMSKNLVKWFKNNQGYYVAGNNDGTIWCDCVECRKTDPEEEIKAGCVSTRYWTFLNKLAGKVYKECPDADLWGWAYQNFQAPPAGIIPDKRVHVMQVYNRRCTRHRLDDPACPVNKVFLEYFKGWQKLGNPTSTWEQIDSSSVWYMPMENTYVNDIYTYKKLNTDGAMIVTMPWDFLETRYKGTMIEYGWRGMWQTVYLSAQLLWNVDQDKESLLEEASALYYGKAWKNGMKQFRELLNKSAQETSGCFGHGLGSPVGRCLDQPGIQEKLLAYLAEAEKAAADDPRALAHVLTDKKLFEMTWIAERKKYLETYREFKAYQKKSPIVIDGEFNEPDWKDADIATGFILQGSSPAKSAVAQTFVKAVYDRDNIYFAVTAMEPDPSGMKCDARKLGEIWDECTLEIFLQQLDLGTGYVHLAVTPKDLVYAAICDTVVKENPVNTSGTEFKNKILDDRWCLEIRIPAHLIGMNFSPGSTWRFNTARARNLKNKTSEYSSLANGVFGGSASFLPLALVRERIVTSNGEVNLQDWKNPAFNEVRKPEKGLWPDWTGWDIGESGLVPQRPGGWLPMSSKPGKFELLPKAPDSKDYYLKLSGGSIFNFCSNDTDGKFKIRLNASGKGEFKLGVIEYEPIGKGGEVKFITWLKPTQEIISADSPEWKTFESVFEKKNLKNIFAVVLAHQSGEPQIDDVYVYPVK